MGQMVIAELWSKELGRRGDNRRLYVLASIIIADFLLSALAGIAGFTTLWGAKEVIDHRAQFEFQRE